MDPNKRKSRRRIRRQRRIRKKVIGTAEKPRLSVFRSLKHFYGQVIDDEKGHTILACSTLDKSIKGQLGVGGNREAAQIVGREIAKKALAAGLKKVAFDRGGFKFHGRIKAMAEAARKEGLVF
ncbi:MAG: 50S ribosomal protein L18 [Planctomycetota bacterium]|jgi:large subunit ribosomal protein L18